MSTHMGGQRGPDSTHGIKRNLMASGVEGKHSWDMQREAGSALWVKSGGLSHP